SGSFVSPNGLVMTNHHVATETMQKLSTEQNDLVKRGFYAKTPADELKAPDLELNQLVSIEDVTARVKAAVKPGMSGPDAAHARMSAIAAIEKESLDKTGLRSDVMPFYRGAEFHLYRYKKFTDVRLVFAPEFDIGNFGGDPDNFNFPRFDLDVAFFRVYENGKPYEPKHWFAWSNTGLKDGDLTIVSGHPGGTRRMCAVAELEFSRDFALPLQLKWMEREVALLHKYAETGPEEARNAQEDISGTENDLKDARGQFDGLKNPELMKRMHEAEAALLKGADPLSAKALAAAYDVIVKARENFKSFFKEFKLVEEGYGFESDLFGRALELVRLADERAKPDGQRLAEYTDARRESLEQELFSPAPISAPFEKMRLTKSFELLLEELGADHPVTKLALEGKTPAARAAELIDGTKLADPVVRKRIAESGKKAIDESTDPLIVLARKLDPYARTLAKRFRDELETPETQAYETIASVWKAPGGVCHYPDATFTLRLSFGTVKGYEEGGKMLAPFTTLGGLFERADEHGNKEPFVLTKNWWEKKASIDLKTPFNFVSTNDIIGGNSGSPVLNSNAEIVGLIFDGNIYSLVGDFFYDETNNRAVAVDARAIVEALNKVYNADALLKELGVK
ncbi:MAG TPA: S46 family peptidase, partial [Planctomycetota bacterium]|nr:S46 family peptidase [Planctomycetota bacterium]